MNKLADLLEKKRKAKREVENIGVQKSVKQARVETTGIEKEADAMQVPLCSGFKDLTDVLPDSRTEAALLLTLPLRPGLYVAGENKHVSTSSQPEGVYKSFAL